MYRSLVNANNDAGNVTIHGMESFRMMIGFAVRIIADKGVQMIKVVYLGR